jgi:hypothetical protein
MEIAAHDYHLGLLGPERLDWTPKLYSGCQADVVVTSVTSLFPWVCLSSGGSFSKGPVKIEEADAGVRY